MRIELKLQLVIQILLLKGLVLTHIGRDHFLDLAGLQQQAKAEIIDPAIVADHGDVLDAGIAQRKDQVFRNATQTKAASHDRHAVKKHAIERSFCPVVYFFYHSSQSTIIKYPLRRRVIPQ